MTRALAMTAEMIAKALGGRMARCPAHLDRKASLSPCNADDGKILVRCLGRDVIVLADGDEAGDAAARDAALRWKREGRRVRIARPPQGYDFNDLLLGRAPNIEEGVQ